MRKNREIFCSFKIAKEHVRKLQLKNCEEYAQWSKHSRPEMIPSSPNQFYKNEWTSWGDYLGTNNKWNRTKQFWSFEKAREWMHRSGIKTCNEFSEKRAKGLIPEGIPSHPEQYYSRCL